MTKLIELKNIETARAELPADIRRTPILPLAREFAEIGNERCFLKCENLQVTGAFKIRAAFTMLNALPEDARNKGVVLASSGNFAQGFAYAGTLEENELLEVLSEARDNASFASPDEFSGLAEPDGVKSVSLEVYSDGVNSLSTSKKIDYALELERLTLSTDKRISGIESSEYTDVVSESAIATSTGIRSSSKESGCCLMVYALAEENNETQTGFGFSIGRTPEDLDIAKAAFDASDRATRMLGSTKPKSCLLYTSPSPRDGLLSRMPSSA